jgi:hypothetical protein
VPGIRAVHPPLYCPQQNIFREDAVKGVEAKRAAAKDYPEGTIVREDAAKRSAANDFCGRKYISYGCSEARRSEAGRRQALSGNKEVFS